jgi:outer membrane receptor protein involved in Fe transport
MMRKFFAGLVACFFCIGMFAQDAVSWTVTGRVVDAASDPVEFATVALYTTKDVVATYTVTGANGLFSLACPAAGAYYLSVSFVGYETHKSPVFRLNENNISEHCADIVLHSVELTEVEVLGKKRQIVYKLDKKIIEAAGNIAAAGGTAIDILSQTPSVRVDADGEVSFRGSSGFKVYIDGKPETLTGSAALEQIPAEHIENIEIITTPSARYEADGIAGIINVVTKKQAANGWSGMLNGKGSSLGMRGLDFFTSYRKDNIRWQTSGEASRRYRISDFDQFKKIDVADTLTTTHSFGERKSYIDAYFLQTGVEWDKRSSTWTASVEGRYGIRNRGGHLNYEDSYTYGSNATVEALFTGGDFVNLDEWAARGDIGFNHRFSRKGSQLTGSFFAFYQGNAMEFFYTDLFHPDGSRAQGHRAEEYEYRFTAQGQLDYVRPFNEKGGKIEAGYYFYTYTEDGDYRIWMYDPAYTAASKFGNGFEPRDDLYTSYLFRRDIHALYGILSDTHGRFSYQVGLRGEYRYRKLDSSAEWARHTWHNFDLFPSIHTAYTLNKGGRLNLSYSRRVTQPALFYMEPYVVYVDFYTAQRGSPLILPEYTNSYEFTYSKGFGDNSVSATLFHRTRYDKIERVRVPYHTGVTLDSMANVGNDYSSGAELATSFQPKPWWSFDVNGSLYHYAIKNEYKTNGAQAQSLNWQLAVNNNFDITKTTRMRLEGYYVGPSVSTQGRVDEFFYFNFSLRQQLFNRKMTVTLNFQDVLSTAKYVNSQTGNNLYSQTTIHPRWPFVMLSVSYLFNNFKSKNGDEKANHDLFEGSNR